MLLLLLLLLRCVHELLRPWRRRSVRRVGPGRRGSPRGRRRALRDGGRGRGRGHVAAGRALLLALRRRRLLLLLLWRWP